MLIRVVMSLVVGLSLAVGGLSPRGLGGACETLCIATKVVDQFAASDCCCSVASAEPESGTESDSACCCSGPVNEDSCCASELPETSCCDESQASCSCSSDGGCICCGVLQRGGDCRCPSTPSTLLAGRVSSLESIAAEGRGLSGDVGYPSLTIPVRVSVAVGAECVPRRPYRAAGVRAQTNVRTI